MGSLVVKIDNNTRESIQNKHHYSDIDMLTAKNTSTQKEIPFVYDVEAVKQSIRNILMWRVGESILRPEFGHNIHKSMYKQLDQFNKDKVAEEIKRALEFNESRIEVQTVALTTDSTDDENNTLRVQVVYKVKSGNRTSDSEMVEASISEK